MRTGSAYSIVRLDELSTDDLLPLLAASELEGFRFVRRVVDEWHSGANRFSRRGEALFGARIDGRLVGICGLTVDPYTNQCTAGRLRHLYVLPDVRGCGIGAALTSAVVSAAAGVFQTVRLRAGTPDAARFYEHLGFRACNGVPECTHLVELPGGLPDRYSGARAAEVSI